MRLRVCVLWVAIVVFGFLWQRRILRRLRFALGDLLRQVRAVERGDNRVHDLFQGVRVALSRLIAADAHVYEAEGKHETAHDLYTTALGMLTELSKDAEGNRLTEIQKDMAGLRLYIGENLKGASGDLSL